MYSASIKLIIVKEHKQNTTLFVHLCPDTLRAKRPYFSRSEPGNGAASPALLHRACAVNLRSKAVVSRAVSAEPRRGPVPLPPRFRSDRKASILSVKSVSLSGPGMAVCGMTRFPWKWQWHQRCVSTVVGNFRGEVLQWNYIRVSLSKRSSDWLTRCLTNVASRFLVRMYAEFLRARLRIFHLIRHLVLSYWLV